MAQGRPPRVLFLEWLLPMLAAGWVGGWGECSVGTKPRGGRSSSAGLISERREAGEAGAEGRELVKVPKPHFPAADPESARLDPEKTGAEKMR